MFNKELRTIFNTPISSAGKFLSDLGISPNILTGLVLTSGLAGAFFISQGKFLLAAAFVLVSGLLDIMDGAVSRYRQKNETFGYLFDGACDKFTEFSWYVALPLYDSAYYLPCLLAAGLTLFSSYITERALTKGGRFFAGAIDRADRLVLIFIGLLFPNYLEIIIYFIAGISFFTGWHRLFKNYLFLNDKVRP